MLYKTDDRRHGSTAAHEKHLYFLQNCSQYHSGRGQRVDRFLHADERKCEEKENGGKMEMKCYRKDYPRPQFVRNNWENLNGTWDFGFDDGNVGEKERWYENFPGDREIQVPFTYETKKSGIGDETRHDNVWYRKKVTVDGGQLSQNRYIIHFEGSDFVTKLWVNGRYVGSHRGGYARFSFDITDLVQDDG